MLTNILIAVGLLIVVAVVAVLAVAAAKPNTFRIERSAVIHAPPARIFPFINDFRSWTGWSPWEKMDPNLKRTYGGAPAGTGAVYEWEGSKKVGQGRMEIKEAVPTSKVTIQLDFIKPFEAHNFAEFTLAPEGDGTRVTWAMHGPRPFMFKVMTTLISMDRMVGKDFEAGLASLKALAEK